MDWLRALSRLENDVIKVDVMASDEAEFMATHVPFQSLLVQAGGKMDASSERWGEEEVYQRLIVNPQNQHRLIMVRGSNGAGKSHLIRWLKARFESRDLNRQNERVVFVQRLGNTFRGAISQLLDEGVVQDQELETRLRSFVAALDNQDEGRFLSTIYSNFVDEVRNDTESEEYTAGDRKDVAAFLSDDRVRQRLITTGGPVRRCYEQITMATGKVFGGEAAFLPSDFQFDRPFIREVESDSSKEAKRFIKRLKAEEDEAPEQLADYLNRFTSQVINRCANISSGDTREIFAQLRRELKRQGKSLTIFIEDFTSFRSVDTELITVLATEHGGANSDLCRVTAVVGITEGYYQQFKDNFTDRVTHQIEVDEQAYSHDVFLDEMAARYLNAIYCQREMIRDWYQQGALATALPQGEFKPPIAWHSTDIGGRRLTLYPFSRGSLIRLYQSLDDRKTPREFLRILRDQLSAFIRDQLEATRFFPVSVRGVLTWSSQTHRSYVDRQSGFDERDKERLRTLLCIWGSGDAYECIEDGRHLTGGVSQAFLAILGLGEFKGILSEGATTRPDQSVAKPGIKVDPVSSDPAPRVIPAAERSHEERKRALDEWRRSTDKSLAFSLDFRTALRQFLSSAINWQAEGIPAHVARLRLSSLVYIDGQTQEASQERALIYLERDADSYDVLLALLEFSYHGHWDFEGGIYSQLALAEWLEQVKPELLQTMRAEVSGRWPVFRWAMSVEYHRLAIMGLLPEGADAHTVLRLLFDENTSWGARFQHKPGRWQDLIDWMGRTQQEFQENKKLLIEFYRTYMGNVAERGGTVHFYHVADILDTFHQLQADSWCTDEVQTARRPAGIPARNAVAMPHELMSALASRIGEAVQQEQARTAECLQRVCELIGPKLRREQFQQAGYDMADFLNKLNDHQIPYRDVRMQDIVAMQEDAGQLARLCQQLQQATNETSVGKLLGFYSVNPCFQLDKVLTLMQRVARIAEEQTVQMQRNLESLQSEAGMGGVDEQSVQQRLQRLETRVAKLGVNESDF